METLGFKPTPGQVYTDRNNRYWLGLKNDDSMHLNECVANLFTGEIVHYSRVNCILTPVDSNNIIW